MQCPGQESFQSASPLLPEAGQEESFPGRWWESGALVQPGLFALVALLSFSPLCIGASSQVRVPAWGSLVKCNSAFEDWNVEPEPCPISKHQADESRSPAVHCYPHFSMLCSWEARCTDWIPLGSSGGLGLLTEDALCSTISYVP